MKRMEIKFLTCYPGGTVMWEMTHLPFQGDFKSTMLEIAARGFMLDNKTWIAPGAVLNVVDLS